MGLFKSFVSQTRKPEGFLGKMMLRGMNSGHAMLADWGFSLLPKITPSKALDLGCGGGRNAGELLKKYPDIYVTAVDYSDLSVAKAREYNRDMIVSGRCTVQQGDVSDLHLPEENYDLATALRCSRGMFRISICRKKTMTLPPRLRRFISGRVWKSALGRWQKW